MGLPKISTHPLARLSTESTHRTVTTPHQAVFAPQTPLLLTAAYLVRREQVAVFRQQVENLRSTFPETRLLCTGPWSPFSFVAMNDQQ